MTPHATPSSLRCLPREFQTRSGEGLRLELLSEPLHRRLVDMYLAFQPRGSIQGLPPLKDSQCVKWVEGLIESAINIVALAGERDLVGHIALFTESDATGEILVVVSPRHQGAGIGTELVCSCLGAARELGFKRLVLTVDARNNRARHVYTRCGFQYVSDKRAREIDMVCDLG